MNWRQHNRAPIGLDIGAASVRGVQLRRKGRSWEVLAAGEVALAGVGDAGRDSVRDAVRQVLREHGFRGRRVVVGLPSGAIEIKNMRLPQMPEAELLAAAEFEARERFQDFGDVIIRALPAGLVGRAGEEQQELIVLAARKDAVEARLRMLTDLGLTVEGMEPTFSAFFRPFARFLQRSADADTTNACVDVGMRGAHVIVARGPEIVFVKACPVGGEAFDRAVADALQLPLAQARTLRRRCLADERAAPAEVEQVKAALQAPLEQLGREIGLCLRYYAVTFRGDRPEQVACGGSEAAYGVIRAGLSESTGLPVETSDCLRGIAAGAIFNESEMATGLPGWTTAVGLALHGGRSAERAQRVA